MKLKKIIHFSIDFLILWRMVQSKKLNYMAKTYRRRGMPEHHWHWFLWKFWQQIGEPEFAKTASGIETYDHHRLQCLSVFLSKVLYSNKFINAKTAEVKTDRNFGLLSNDKLNKMKEPVDRCFGTTETDKLPAVKRVCASNKLK